MRGRGTAAGDEFDWVSHAILRQDSLPPSDSMDLSKLEWSDFFCVSFDDLHDFELKSGVSFARSTCSLNG